MTHAFLEIATTDDLTDLVTLLRSGVTVGVTAHPGQLYGPERAAKAFGVEAVKKSRTFTATRLDEFVHAFLDVSDPIEVVHVPDCADTEAMREAWAIMNPCAGIPLTRFAILKLALLLGRWVGTGRVEVQLPYGDEDWEAFVKGGYGHLTLWCRPSEDELQQFADHGAKGVILAEKGREWFGWFAGLSGPFPMPVYGTIIHDPAHSPHEAVEAARAPCALSGAWDRSKRSLPLCGLLRGFDEDVEGVKALALSTMREVKAGQGYRRSPRLIVSVEHPTIARQGAGEWIAAHWRDPFLFRVDFD